MSDHPGAQDVLGGAKLCSRCQQRLPLNSFTPNPAVLERLGLLVQKVPGRVICAPGGEAKDFDPVTSLLIHHWRSARR
jgi:hypothetical protein